MAGVSLTFKATAREASYEISMKHFKAIAAMSLNRVIGNGNKIPWHLPEDFKWFKATTTGHIIVMGRKTFESIGKPLPNRETIVLSRSGFSFPGVTTIRSLDALPANTADRQVFICGGAQIYEQALPLCSEILLTLVKREVPGDAFFPPFEDQFQFSDTVRETPEFKILRYARVPLSSLGDSRP
ncbi:MAG TPA: dihydrofolate reductase [Verrucomicrobiae bacterium]|nr:dihydrofolate reductase [Verrucomicrobiae bacterium]